MNGFGQWLRSFGAKAAGALARFMHGRYGTDRLNMVILCAGLAASLLSTWIKIPLVSLSLWALSYGLMIWAIFRSLSRNTYRRYMENRKFFQLTEQIKDRDHRYYACPKCRQTVRVPRGKGKISITCPRCKERFVKKT